MTGGRDTRLVLAATGRSADLIHAVERLEILAPSKLIITRLDEATAPGAMLAARFRTGKPVSLLGAGQRIPEDLQPATREYLIDRLLENCWSETPAAA